MALIGLGQFNASTDRDRNLAEIESLAQRAGEAGVGLLALHELATTTYFCYRNDPAFRALAEPEDGPSLTRVREAARLRGVAIAMPFYERGDDRRLYNSTALIDPHGEIVGKYRKMSIPLIKRTVDPDETPGDEQFYFTPGDLGFPVYELAGLRVGVLICYDRHFPEAARSLALAGAELMLVPTATYRAWIRRVWEAELIGHAIANCFYVAGINRVGVEDGGAPDRSYWGSSVVVDPLGRVVTRAGEEPGLVTAEVSPGAVADARDLWGFLRCRRPDAYGAVTQPIAGQQWPVVTAPPDDRVAESTAA